MEAIHKINPDLSGRFTITKEADWVKSCTALSADGPSTANFAVHSRFSAAIGRLRERNGRPEQHEHSARVFVIRQGAGTLRIGGILSNPEIVAPGELLGSDENYIGYETVPLRAGTIVTVAEATPYQLVAEAMDFTFLVVRIEV